MYDNCYYDEQTLFKFFKTLTKIPGSGPEFAERIITEIQNEGFLIRERTRPTTHLIPTTPRPKAYRGLSVVEDSVIGYPSDQEEVG